MELGRCLRAPSGRDRAIIDDELEPVGAEPVGQPEREVSRHRGAGDSHLLHDPRDDLTLRFGMREPLLA